MLSAARKDKTRRGLACSQLQAAKPFLTIPGAHFCQALARLLGKVMCRSVVSREGALGAVLSVCKVRWLSSCVWRAIDGAVGPHLVRFPDLLWDIHGNRGT